MPRGYPPLTVAEVLDILAALGFTFHRHGRGDHDVWIGKKETRVYSVTVDMGAGQFDEYLIQSMVKQAGVGREVFYCATPRTARKIGR